MDISIFQVFICLEDFPTRAGEEVHTKSSSNNRTGDDVIGIHYFSWLWSNLWDHNGSDWFHLYLMFAINYVSELIMVPTLSSKFHHLTLIASLSLLQTPQAAGQRTFLRGRYAATKLYQVKLPMRMRSLIWIPHMNPNENEVPSSYESQPGQQQLRAHEPVWDRGFNGRPARDHPAKGPDGGSEPMVLRQRCFPRLRSGLSSRSFGRIRRLFPACKRPSSCSGGLTHLGAAHDRGCGGERVEAGGSGGAVRRGGGGGEQEADQASARSARASKAKEERIGSRQQLCKGGSGECSQLRGDRRQRDRKRDPVPGSQPHLRGNPRRKQVTLFFFLLKIYNRLWMNLSRSSVSSSSGSGRSLAR